MPQYVFSGPDRVNLVTFNRALWRGLKGDEPYPAPATWSDLLAQRQHLPAKTQSRNDDNRGF
jgi:hypothetical protein